MTDEVRRAAKGAARGDDGRPPAAMTIGVFDGVHRGHRSLVERAAAGAAELGGEAVAVTFDPHPAAVLAPDHVPPVLTDTAEKIGRLLEAGADRAAVLAFTRELAGLSPEEFVDDHLFAIGRLALLVIGPDFALGRGRVGNAERLAAIGRTRGFRVEVVPALVDGQEVISSTRVRRLIQRGEVAVAARLLGRPATVSGRVVTGDGRGRTIGIPTANLDVPAARCRPATGVYAVRIHAEGETTGGHPGVMNVGTRPTFDGSGIRFEVHRLDWTGEAVGRTWHVELVARLREERKFDGVDALVARIRQDVAEARQLLAPQ
jgi:riboflavin kinase/FMN adenylyltransferase